MGWKEEQKRAKGLQICQVQLAHVQLPLTENLCSMLPEFSSKLYKCTHPCIYICAFVCASKKMLCYFTGPALLHSLLSVHPTTRPMCFTYVLNEQWQSLKNILLYNFFLFFNCGVVAAYKSLSYVASCEMVAAAASLIQVLVKVICILLSGIKLNGNKLNWHKIQIK